MMLGFNIEQTLCRSFQQIEFGVSSKWSAINQQHSKPRWSFSPNGRRSIQRDEAAFIDIAKAASSTTDP
jgi:hypothetical protein